MLILYIQDFAIKNISYNLHRILTSINRTFINLLVLLDCLNSLGHVPILIQYFL